MDGLRFTFLLECAESMRRTTEDFRRASWDEDVAAARIHFELMVKIGAAMRDTLQEIEISQKQPAKEAA